MNALRARSSVRSELRIWNATRSVSRFDAAMICARLASFSKKTDPAIARAKTPGRESAASARSVSSSSSASVCPSASNRRRRYRPAGSVLPDSMREIATAALFGLSSLPYPATRPRSC